MDVPVDGPAPSRWPLVLWGLTTLALFSLAQAQDTLIRIVITEYRLMEIKALPSTTEIVVRFRHALWLLPIAASLSGIPFVWRSNLEKAKLWTLVILLLTLIHASMIGVALFQPFTRIICGLGR